MHGHGGNGVVALLFGGRKGRESGLMMGSRGGREREGIAVGFGRQSWCVGKSHCLLSKASWSFVCFS